MVLWVANPSLEEDEVPDVQTRQHQTRQASRATSAPVLLPPDILRLIVVLWVTRPPDLASVAQTSRYLNEIATPLLYSALSFGPTAFSRSIVPGRAHSSNNYVSTSANFPLLRADAGAEDSFFDNRSSLCAETLGGAPHLLSYARTLSTKLTVVNYASAVRASRGQRSSEDQAFHEWSTLLHLPQASNLRHLALAEVHDQHLRDLTMAKHLKLVALELSVPLSALPELSCLAPFLQRQRLITHFASRNLADIKGLQGSYVPRLISIDVPAALACQLAPGRPITTARIFPLATRRAAGVHSADEVLMAIHALAQSTNSAGVTDLDISVLWYGDARMGEDCCAFFTAIRDSLRGLRRLRITLWSDLTPTNVDVLFDCIMTTLPALEFLQSFEVRTWAEYGINHPSHVPPCTRRALFDLWKELCPSLLRVAAIERHTWVWHVSKPQPSPSRPPPPPLRSNSDPEIIAAPGQRPLPPRPRPASGDWVKLSGRWDWKPTKSPLAQSFPSTTAHPPSPGPSRPSLDPVPRNATPDVYRVPQAGGSWVRERERVKLDEPPLTWSSDFQVVGSTYQRNSLDEHYVRVARSSESIIQFAIPPVRTLGA